MAPSLHLPLSLSLSIYLYASLGSLISNETTLTFVEILKAHTHLSHVTRVAVRYSLAIKIHIEIDQNHIAHPPKDSRLHEPPPFRLKNGYWVVWDVSFHSEWRRAVRWRRCRPHPDRQAEGPYSNYKPRTNCLPLQADTMPLGPMPGCWMVRGK